MTNKMQMPRPSIDFRAQKKSSGYLTFRNGTGARSDDES